MALSYLLHNGRVHLLYTRNKKRATSRELPWLIQHFPFSSALGYNINDSQRLTTLHISIFIIQLAYTFPSFLYFASEIIRFTFMYLMLLAVVVIIPFLCRCIQQSRHTHIIYSISSALALSTPGKFASPLQRVGAPSSPVRTLVSSRFL